MKGKRFKNLLLKIKGVSIWILLAVYLIVLLIPTNRVVCILNIALNILILSLFCIFCIRVVVIGLIRNTGSRVVLLCLVTGIVVAYSVFLSLGDVKSDLTKGFIKKEYFPISEDTLKKRIVGTRIVPKTYLLVDGKRVKVGYFDYLCIKKFDTIDFYYLEELGRLAEWNSSD